MSLRIKFILPIVLILIAVFLRFYRFSEFVMFLGDQGRDTIIVKRIITLEHFPAIGAPSSLGQIYLGPFYYYLIVPFLFLFNFNPLGPAFGVGLMSLLGIIVSFFIVRKETGFGTAFGFLFLSALSFVNIQSSRFSWNPNLLPVFSFLTLYFFYKILTDKNKLFAILFGSFLSFSIQLHHLAFILFLPITLIFILYVIKKNEAMKQFSNLTISAASFLLFSLPLVIFDLRHQFLNSKNLIKFFFEGNPTDHEEFINKFFVTNQQFYNFVFQTSFNQYLAFAITLLTTLFIIKIIKRKFNLFITVNLLLFISYLILFSFFNSPKNPHYYNPIYFSFFLLISWLINNLIKNKLSKILIILLVFLPYLYFNVKSLNYLFLNTGTNQLKIAENIANSIIRENPEQPFQTVALPNVETDGHIRYFLEIKNLRPLPADTLEESRELYVLCFEKTCNVLGNPQWQIASFKNAKIDKEWKVEDVRIYKVVHAL